MKSEWNIYCKEKLKSFQIKAIIEPKWRAQLELWILSSLKAVLWITSVQSINSVLWVFLGLKFGNDAIQLSLCFALWKIAHVIILRGNFHQPFWLDVCTCPDVVLRCKDKLIIQHPFWFVIKNSGGMQLHHLVIFHG